MKRRSWLLLLQTTAAMTVAMTVAMLVAMLTPATTLAEVANEWPGRFGILSVKDSARFSCHERTGRFYSV